MRVRVDPSVRTASEAELRLRGGMERREEGGELRTYICPPVAVLVVNRIRIGAHELEMRETDLHGLKELLESERGVEISRGIDGTRRRGRSGRAHFLKRSDREQ